jgi:hypothetical protein
VERILDLLNYKIIILCAAVPRDLLTLLLLEAVIQTPAGLILLPNLPVSTVIGT